MGLFPLAQDFSFAQSESSDVPHGSCPSNDHLHGKWTQYYIPSIAWSSCQKSRSLHVVPSADWPTTPPMMNLNLTCTVLYLLPLHFLVHVWRTEAQFHTAPTAYPSPSLANKVACTSRCGQSFVSIRHLLDTNHYLLSLRSHYYHGFILNLRCTTRRRPTKILTHQIKKRCHLLRRTMSPRHLIVALFDYMFIVTLSALVLPSSCLFVAFPLTPPW